MIDMGAARLVSASIGSPLGPFLAFLNTWLSIKSTITYSSMLRMIRIFLGILDPLVRGPDPDPAPDPLSKNSKKNLDYYSFVTFYL